MRYNELNEILVNVFPELSAQIRHEYEFWGNERPPTHCLYANVLNQFVVSLLTENNDSLMLKRVFDFYEDMVKSEDSEVRNLLQTTLLEYIWDHEAAFKNLNRYILPETKVINDAIKDYLYEPKYVD